MKNDSNLKENMVITDEPGIYIPGKFGIRIEDTLLVTKKGAISLTESSKECIILRVWKNKKWKGIKYGSSIFSRRF